MTPRSSILVTGAGGFLGTELCAQLAASFWVVGAALRNPPSTSGIDWITVNAPESLGQTVRDVKPDIVIHAAFRNRKPPDWSEEKYLNEALSVSQALFDAITANRSKMLFVSSSAVYGNGAGRAVIDEATPLAPISPYGRAKTAVERMALSYTEKGMKLCIVRPFNLLGPRLQSGTFMSDWVMQAAAVQRGETDAIHVRHRRTQRDFVDVRDASRALVMLATNFQTEEVFNIAAERPVDLMEVSVELERLVGQRLRFVETASEIDPTDVRSQCGSSEKLRTTTGWRALIPWQKSLADLWSTVVGAAGIKDALDSRVQQQ